MEGLQAASRPPAAQRLRDTGTPQGVPSTLRPDAGHPRPPLPRVASRLGAGPPDLRTPDGTDTRPQPRQPGSRTRPAGRPQGDRAASGWLACQRAAGPGAAALQADPAAARAAVPIDAPRLAGQRDAVTVLPTRGSRAAAAAYHAGRDEALRFCSPSQDVKSIGLGDEVERRQAG